MNPDLAGLASSLAFRQCLSQILSLLPQPSVDDLHIGRQTEIAYAKVTVSLDCVHACAY